MKLLKKYAIPLILTSLVLCIAYLSHYNYTTQRDLLLKQVHDNSLNIASSVTSAIKRFEDVKSTMNLQKLVDDVSFGLDIFEFRYIKPDGVIRNSIFKEEINSILTSASFIETLQGDRKINTFFFEVRDYVDVMSIYYPIYNKNKLIGIIDLAVDISEYNLEKGSQEQSSIILHRQTDILNLLKSISGSIANSLTILKKTNINDFLYSYVNSSKNIVDIFLIDEKDEIKISSKKHLIGTKFGDTQNHSEGIAVRNHKLTYLNTIDTDILHNNSNMRLVLLTDATTYSSHEGQLFTTAAITSAFALLFALFTSRMIYYTALEQSRIERERLEHLVQVRTKEIELLSKTDALTGLWNRHYLEETLEKEFKRAKRYKHELSIMIIDLDHFKNINDTYGHMAGDEVLRQISQRIKDCQRETDFIGRYGGEEIVVILPETNLEKAVNVAESIRKAVEEEPVTFESQDIEVTTSIGVSSLKTEHTEYAMIFAESDEVLYNAKELGRNRVEFFKA